MNTAETPVIDRASIFASFYMLLFCRSGRKAQALAIRDRQGKDRFDLAIASSDPQAKETVQTLTGKEGVTIISSLGWPTDPENPLSSMFEALTYAPLRQYFGHKDSEHIKVWAQMALGDIIREVKKLQSQKRAKVLVTSDALSVPAIVWAIGDVLENSGAKSGNELKELALELSLAEGEVLAMSFAAVATTNDVQIVRLKP